MIDNFKREINYLRISITDRCNLRCSYCMPLNGIQTISHNEILSYDEIEHIISIFNKLGINKIRFSGGEPLVRKGFLDWYKKIIEKFNNKIKFYMTTNLTANSEQIKKINDLNLSGINISLDTLNNDKFKKISRNDNINLSLIINNLKKLKIKDIKLNTVLIKNFNDDEIESLIKFADYNNFTIRFIEKMNWIEDNFQHISKEELKNKLLNKKIISKDFFFTENSVAKYYKLKNSNNSVGFIASHSKPFCDRCNRIRLTSDGNLLLCLYSKKKYNIKQYLRNKQIDDNELNNIIKNIILKKKITELTEKGEKMYAIGG